jgi:hypothetical protein
MHPIHLTVLAIATAAAAGCAHAPQPFSFTAAQAPNDVDLVVRTLVANGLQPAAVDRASGTVTTRWFDTGYRFRTNYRGDSVAQYTDIYLRHKVSIRHANGKDTIVLDTDVQRCSPTDSLVTATGVRGTCLPLAVLFPTQQKQIDQLGERLRLALAGADSTGAKM